MLQRLRIIFLTLFPIFIGFLAFAQEPEKELTKSQKDSMAVSPEYLSVHTATYNPTYYNVLKFTPIDTGIYNVNFYDPTFLPQNIYQTIGLNGQAHHNMIFEYAPDRGYFIAESPYPLYFKKQSDLLLYKLETTYTDISYSYGMPQENAFRLAFAKQMGQVNTSVNLFANHNVGSFLHQAAGDVFGDVLIHYEIPSGIYGFRASYIINNTNLQENGGLADIEEYKNNQAINNQVYAVNTPYGMSKMTTHDVMLQQYVNIKNKEGVNFSTFTHNFQYQRVRNYYQNFNDSIFTNDIPPVFVTDSLRDSLRCYVVSNTLQWSNYQPYTEISDQKKYFFHLAGGVTHDFYRDENLKKNYNSFTVFGRTQMRLFTILDLYADISYVFGGYTNNDAVTKIRAEWALSRKNEHFIGLEANIYSKEPDYFYSHFQSATFEWDTNYRKQRVFHFAGFWKRKSFKVAANYYFLDRYCFIDESMSVKQLTSNAHLIQGSFYLPFRWRGLGITANLNVQYSSNDSLSLPVFAGKLSAFYAFKIFKNKFQVQVGADLMYNTPYYGNGYAPELRSFYAQYSYKTGNHVYLNAFVAIRISRIYAFFRAGNLLTPLQNFNAITTPGYALKEFNLAFGIRWRFHD